MLDCYVVFWKGHGVIPCLIRAFTRRSGQLWKDVPSHCAILIPEPNHCVEYEAIVTGIRRSVFRNYDEVLLTDGVVGWCNCGVSDIGFMKSWLDSQVGKPYGFITVASTGLGIVSPPAWDRIWERLWEHLSGGKGGRTAPLNCSLLCRTALEVGGVAIRGRVDGLPVSPNDLYLILRNPNEDN